MTGLVEAFSRTASGELFEPFPGVEDICAHLRNTHLSSESAEHERRERMRMRIDMFHDRGRPYFENLLRTVFAGDAALRDEYARVLPYAMYQNVTRGVARILSKVYAKEPRRSVEGKTNSGYQNFIRATKLNQRGRQANLYANVANDVLFFLRYKQRSTGRVPFIDIIPSDRFTPIADPNDPTELIGVVIDSAPCGIGVTERTPHYIVWTNDLVFRLDKNKHLVEGTVAPNPYGEIPAVLVHRELGRDELVDGYSGSDIIAAHFAVVLLNVLMLRGQKVGTKVPYTRGDTTGLTRGQTLDQAAMTEFPDDVSPGVLDLGHDPQALIQSARTVIAQAAANHGIPEDVFYQKVQASSGDQLELLLMPLRERRDEQVMIFRDAERSLAYKASRLLPLMGVEPRYRFDAHGFSIDYGEIAMPMSPQVKNTYRQAARSLGTRSPIDDIMDDDPDIQTREEAKARLLRNAGERAWWVDIERKLNMPANANAENPGRTPQANGALGPQAKNQAPGQGAQGDQPPPSAGRLN